MSVVDDLSPEFSDWVATAEWELVDQGELCVIADAGSEIRFLLRRTHSGEFSLSQAIRSEDETSIAWSDGSVVVERYLTAQLGEEIRDLRGLPPIDLPWKEEDMPPSLRISEADGRTLTLVGTTDGFWVRFADRGLPQPIFAYAAFANASLEDIRRSYLDPAGAPLFSNLVEDPLV